MLKSIKLRLYLNDDQKIYSNKLLGSSRFVYNNCLNYKITEYNKPDKKSVSFCELGKHLTDLKSEYIWLKDSHSKVLQQSLINLNTAFNNFFKNKLGFPKFKSKHDKQSCRFPIDAISGVKGNRINIIKSLNDIHFKCSKSDESFLNHHQSDIKSGTLSRSKSGDYYFSILIDKPNKKLNKPKNEIVGIDMGIKDFVITSSGDRFENIKIKRNNTGKLKRLNQLLSRKQKGSKNKEKTRIKLSKFHEKLNNIKDYYLHKVSNQLLNENQIIVMEDLNVKGMMSNHKLAKSIQELSLNKFKNILMYKSNWYDRSVIQVDQWFPSSKLCSVCGFKHTELTLNDREWVCPVCLTKHDRDVNAANNIKNEGINILSVGLSSPDLKPLESSTLVHSMN